MTAQRKYYAFFYEFGHLWGDPKKRRVRISKHPKSYQGPFATKTEATQAVSREVRKYGGKVSDYQIGHLTPAQFARKWHGEGAALLHARMQDPSQPMAGDDDLAEPGVHCEMCGLVTCTGTHEHDLAEPAFSSNHAMKKSPAQIKREIDAVLARTPIGPGRSHAMIRGSHSPKESNEDRSKSIAFGTKWAEDRFREDPNYAAFTPSMVWIDPAVVPDAKRRESQKNLICSTAVKRWRELQEQTKQSRGSVSNLHARKKKLDPHEAKQGLRAAGIDFSSDFHQLPRSQVQLLLDTARSAGYRKRRDAPGSTARMYFQYLSRLR